MMKLNLFKVVITVLLVIYLLPGCSTGTKSKPRISLVETPLSENSSRIVIESDLREWSAVAGSLMLGCKIAKLTKDRGYKYYYLDQKSRSSDMDVRPSFKLTFYNSLPKGMSVSNPMTAIVYEGEWADHYETGSGKIFYRDGARYEGEWVSGKPHGQGIMISAIGDRYEGDWQEGNRHGRGVMLRNWGDKYEGEWRHGRKHGSGTMIYANGVRYEGEWNNGGMTGHGVFLTQQGERHEGKFFDGTGVSSQGKYITPYSLGIGYKGDFESYRAHEKIALMESAKALEDSAIDAQAEGFLDLCKEARDRIYLQNKILLDLSPR